MKSDKEKAIKKVSLEEAHIKERVSFKSLLLSNPNYFGNLADSKLKAVLQIAGNTNAIPALPQPPWSPGRVIINTVCDPGP